MAENLSALIVGIIDHLDEMAVEQEILQLCQEEFQQPDEKARFVWSYCSIFINRKWTTILTSFAGGLKS